jgi:hypothetical protein
MRGLFEGKLSGLGVRLNGAPEMGGLSFGLFSIEN